MFTPTDHAHLGQTLTYTPAETTFDRAAHTCNTNGGTCIMHPGDAVDVLSAWNRNAYDGDTMTLLYVRSHDTGEATHVPDYEIAA